MRSWQALYYPRIEPPVGWLRSAALFFDHVRSFVPADSEKLLSKDIIEFSNATGAWLPYRPSEQTALLMDLPERDLDSVFEAIAQTRKNDAGSVNIVIGPGGGFRIAEHVLMHASKLSDRVKERLQVHGLVLPQEFCEGLIDGDWCPVDERASDFILSYISDKLAGLEGWTSITNNEGCYVFNVVEHVQSVTTATEPENQLTRLMVSDLVPEVVELLSLKEYCELRKRYAPIREKLNEFIYELVVRNRLGHVGNAKELHDAVGDSIKDLRHEVYAFKESRFGKNFRKWAPFSLGGLITLARPLIHLKAGWALSLEGASLLLMAVDKAGMLDRKMTNRSEMVRLLAGLRNDIIGSLDIKRFLVP